MSDPLCFDCGVNTLPTEWDERAEWYMVHDAVWMAAGVSDDTPMTTFLCVGCLESRLGRRLRRDDFTLCRVNDLSESDNPRWAWSYRTPRLVDRLSRKSACDKVAS